MKPIQPDQPSTHDTEEPESLSGDALDAGLAVAFEPDATRSHYPTPDLEPGTVVAGRYKLSERIGEGGMGSVWVANQSEPVKRKVALELIKPGMDTKLVLARFEAERQALAMMDHPNIARVLDGGIYDGRPFFVMELVKGVPITDYCDNCKLTPRQRLELFVPVCQAIQHAHHKGIIHRDIKPSNVLIALYDDKPVPKVIDFGVAKATGGSLTEHTIESRFGGVVGTPQYMSPEQATLNNLDIDTRSDVYSLGVLLYELLAGSPPFARKELEERGLLEMLRVVREEEPPRPSTKLSTADALPTLSANRGTEPKKLTGLLRNELDWIVMKALEKDRGRRYETANGFAADIHRYLNGDPVHAYPPSASYRLRKFVRRHRPEVIAASLVVLTLLAGIAGTTWGLVRAKVALRDAEQARMAEEERAEGECLAKQDAVAERLIAEHAEAATLASYRASTDDAIEQLIGSKPDLGRQEKTYLEKTLKRWQAFAARQGDDVRSQSVRAEGHFRVAFLWARLGRKDEARTEYQTARDLFQKLANAFPTLPGYQRDLALTHNNLGMLLRDFGQWGAARAEHETARDLQEKLVAAFPAVPEYQGDLALTHSNLAVVLRDLGQRDAARTQYLTARDLFQKLANAFPAVPKNQRDLARNHYDLGALLRELGQRDAARTEYVTARDLQEKLAVAFPAVPEYQRDLARTHNNLGNVLADLGQREAARTEFETARDLQRKLAVAFPAVPHYQQDLAISHNSLGHLLSDVGQREAARIEFETARDLQQKLAAAFPAVPHYQQDLARTHNKLGLLLSHLGRRDAARTQHEAARDLQQKLTAAFPAVPNYQIDLGGSYCNLGNLVNVEGQPAESLNWFDLAIRTLTPVYENDRRAITARNFLRNSHWNRARAYDQLKKHAEALKDWDKVIELSPGPEQMTARASRAMSRLQAGQVTEAVAEVQALAKTSQWSVDEWYNFACVYAVASSKIADRKLEYADRAMELLHEAIKAGYKNASHIAKDTDLDSLRDREDFKKVLAELGKK